MSELGRCCRNSVRLTLRHDRDQGQLFYEFDLDDVSPKGALLRRMSVFVTAGTGRRHRRDSQRRRSFTPKSDPPPCHTARGPLNLRAHASFNRTTNEGGAFTAAPAQNPSPRWIHKVRSPARQAMQADVAVLGMGRRSVIGVPPLHHQSRCRASKDHRCHAASYGMIGTGALL
jgi:hypothetical protein